MSSDAPVTVTDRRQLPVEKYEWGTLQWLCNDKLSAGAMQTLGVCEILPGRGNPPHYHPNCEELLYVVTGKGTHRIGPESVELRTGMTIRIPLGAVHSLTNVGTGPLVCLISFSSGDRQTVFV